MFKQLKVAALVGALVVTPVWAADFEIDVDGIVCEFCALGVKKKVSKLDFVDRSKFDDGVKVEVEVQKVTVAVKENMSPDKDKLFAAIESAGYNPKQIFELTAEGERIEYQP